MYEKFYYYWLRSKRDTNMQKRRMARPLEIWSLLKASVLSYVLPKIHESKAPAPLVLQKTTLPSYPYSSKILQIVVEAKELWLPVWVSSNYLSFKISCGGASWNDGNAVSENVSLTELRKPYLLILDAWNTSLIRVCLCERTLLIFHYIGGKNGGG